ncbi:glutathione S-transferase T3-like [Oryza brachyantha]|uniref:Myb-like domain-containing protein n=1 Tax=Oryza brachyantha TaxID=4533 RepID=J3N2X8_ORYBR|nr:glutathione S-transferase T3-like [Oryza brachyantha]XP_040380318.1 glutathione S-transferase T3-like [Oryza brachyantha]XP_040383935.1 glutathione S-transferase T3-like [Oryza brachyantha]
MENTSSSLTNLLNSANTSGNPQNPISQQHHFPSPQYPMNYPPTQFPPNFHPQYSHMFNPFGAQSSYPQFPFTPGSYQGPPYLGNTGQGSGQASPVGSMAFFQGSRGTNSRADENSPVGSASPVSLGQQIACDPIDTTDWSERSESSPEESEKKEGRVHWSEEDNLRLVSAWLKNSNDPIIGVDRRGDRYWNDVAAEYNLHTVKERRRKASQCKNHWNKTIPFITKFNGCYDKAKREHGSGESDDQVMDRARQDYKGLVKTKRPFALEYWWRAVKDQPKWSKAYPIEEMMNKRSKLNASGAYTSSNQDSEDADPAARCRPPGRNAAKAKQKSKGKLVHSEDSISNENVNLFNELQLRKTIAAEKMAEATLVKAEAAKVKAEAENKMAEAEKEKAMLQKMDKYMALLDKDTTGYDEVAKTRHEQILVYLAKELFS